MVRNTLHSLWNEERILDAPSRVRRDWLLLAGSMIAVIVEGVRRSPFDLWLVSVAVCGATATSLMWRRRYPFQTVLVGYGAIAFVSAVNLSGLVQITLFYSFAYVLVLGYSLFRWGSGKEAIAGLLLIQITNVLSELANYTGVTDRIFSVAFALLPAALGASVRFRATSQVSQLDRLRLRERETLARELHDTIAHHVSAIAIQAQAGQAIVVHDPEKARETLHTIEDAASRALAEMRLMVGALRDGEDPTLAPQRGINDIQRLADETTVPIDVQLRGRLDDVQPAVEAAVYRLAQESITNAVRHAVDATRITVRVTGEDSDIRFLVENDGRSVKRSVTGFGLAGMAERAKLLGGKLDAGPNADGGWSVMASIPKVGSVV